MTLPAGQRMRRLASPSTATVLGVAAAAFAVAALAISVADHKAANAAIVLIPTTMFAAVGVVVARRQPANPIGWLLIFVALFENMYDFATAYVAFNHWLGHGLNWPSFTALWFENSFWDLGLIVGLPALLLFPDGVVPSRRWRATLRLYTWCCRARGGLAVRRRDDPGALPQSAG